jgi:hypothetical protein
MARPPDIVGAAYVITGAVHIVRPISNCDHHRARIPAVVRAAAAIIRSAIIWPAVIRPVARISGVIVGASTKGYRGANEN